eukprot:3496285-Pyramimonas_sp.AAC.1
MQKQQAEAPARCVRFDIAGGYDDETIRPQPTVVQTVSGVSRDPCFRSCDDASQRAGMAPGLGHSRCQIQEE